MSRQRPRDKRLIPWACTSSPDESVYAEVYSRNVDQYRRIGPYPINADVYVIDRISDSLSIT